MTVIKKLLKIVAAGVVSIVIISGLLCFYDILPVHVENPNGNTDYKWPANSIWIKATEGISFGKNDANGFNNKTVVENPDIIILGSSHMAAGNVMQNENAAYLLSEKLKGKYTVYNMAIPGHHFFKVCQYIPANLELYEKAPKVLIVETTTVKISQKKANEVISSSVEFSPSHSSGIIAALQKVPFFRSLYHQMEEGLLTLFMPNSSSSADKTGVNFEPVDGSLEESIEIDIAAYDRIFSYLKKMEEKYKTQIIIVYHPTEVLMDDGTIYFNKDSYLYTFTSYANDYGISFVDMTKRLEEMYTNEHHVAHGFCTGKLATGHLNKYGHYAIADELYGEIAKLEEAEELCQ